MQKGIALQQTHCITPMYTDLYQFTTSYSYFLCGKQNEPATFECFFRKHPFKGEYAILGGVRQVLALISKFKISESDIQYLKSNFPHMKPEYFDYLAKLSTNDLQVDCCQQGQIVFANQPIVSLSGPLALCQILQTPILNLMGFATLVATNASRMVTAAKGKSCVEFGIRRAQGPDGGLTASQYAYLGGFTGTSNVQCGRKYGVPIVGTMSHAYITSFFSLDDAEQFEINGQRIKELAIKQRQRLKFQNTHSGELAAFLMYARAFPNQFITLIDTYSTLDSGILNTIVVANVLSSVGVTNFGCRLDSGDLCQYAKKCKQIWKKYFMSEFPLKVLASNDLNQESLVEMQGKNSQVDVYAIGTNLATCLKQPALGLVYKLVELKQTLTMKFSQQKDKLTYPGKKSIYRVWTSPSQQASFDLITLHSQIVSADSQLVVVSAANPLVRYSVKVHKVQKVNKTMFKGKLLELPKDIHQAKKHYEQSRSSFNSNIFKLEKAQKYKLFLSIDYYKEYEKTIEKNIVFRKL